MVEKFEFVNPHSFLYVRAENENGDPAIWSCNMWNANSLRRWTDDQSIVGQEVTVMGIAARRDPLGCSLDSAELPDGTIAVSGYRVGLHAGTLDSPGCAGRTSQAHGERHEGFCTTVCL